MRLTRTDNRNSSGLAVHIDNPAQQKAPSAENNDCFVALNNCSLFQLLFRKSLKWTSMKWDRSTCNDFLFNWNKPCIILMCLRCYKQNLLTAEVVHYKGFYYYLVLGRQLYTRQQEALILSYLETINTWRFCKS